MYALYIVNLPGIYSCSQKFTKTLMSCQYQAFNYVFEWLLFCGRIIVQHASIIGKNWYTNNTFSKTSTRSNIHGVVLINGVLCIFMHNMVYCVFLCIHNILYVLCVKSLCLHNALVHIKVEHKKS